MGKKDTVPQYMMDHDKIGKVVTIQVFRRTAIHDELNLDTLEKYVGTLEAVWFDRTSLNFKLQGVPIIATNRYKQYTELYVKE